MDFKELSKEEVEQLSREELFDYLDRKAVWLGAKTKYKKNTIEYDRFIKRTKILKNSNYGV